MYSPLLRTPLLLFYPHFTHSAQDLPGTTTTLRFFPASHHLLFARKLKLAHTRKQHARGGLQDLPLACYSSFVDTDDLHDTPSYLSSYSIYAYESFHNFHVSVSKLIKHAAIEQLRSESLFTTTGQLNILPFSSFHPQLHSAEHGAG